MVLLISEIYIKIIISYFYRFVHHLTEDMKQLLGKSEIKIPLLSHYRHDCDDTEQFSDKEKICNAYKQQVTCADCHSEYIKPKN